MPGDQAATPCASDKLQPLGSSILQNNYHQHDQEQQQCGAPSDAAAGQLPPSRPQLPKRLSMDNIFPPLPSLLGEGSLRKLNSCPAFLTSAGGGWVRMIGPLEAWVCVLASQQAMLWRPAFVRQRMWLLRIAARGMLLHAPPPHQQPRSPPQPRRLTTTCRRSH